MDWRDKLKDQFSSNSKAARALRADWVKLNPAQEKNLPKATSLATRIGKLVRGEDLGWWNKESQRPLQKLLAELIDCDVEEIFGSRPAPPGTIAFREFPGLPPLEPGELPCRFQGSLLGRVAGALRTEQPVWIIAPPGSGKSLAIELLSQSRRKRIVARSVHTLADAQKDFLLENDLVVELEKESDDDLSLVKRLGDVGGVVVLAPFNFPARWWGSSDEEPGRSELGWKVLRYHPPRSWRRKALEWVDDRLEQRHGDTQLFFKDLFEWLRHNDPLHSKVNSFGDLLALCADFDVHGGSAATLPERANRWLEAVAPSMIPDEAPSAWRRHAMIRTLRGLAVARLHDNLSGYGPKSACQWGNLIPTTLLPGDSSGRPGQVMVIAYLTEAGLLRGHEGELELFPRWVARGLEIQEVHRLFEQSTLESWGILAADYQKQVVVDEALDELSDKKFIELARRVEQVCPPTSLSALGALESVVAALARRVGKSDAKKTWDRKLVSSLLERQLAHLTKDSQQNRTPYTRCNPEEWYATGWSLSLAAPQSRLFEDPSLGWEVPGWTDSLVWTSMPERIRWTTPKFSYPTATTLFELAPKILNRLPDEKLPKNMPPFLVPAMLFSRSRSWELTHEHIKDLTGHWEERYVTQEFKRLPLERKAVVARRLWQLAAPGPECLTRHLRAFMKFRRLAPTVLPEVPIDIIAMTARNNGITQPGEDDVEPLRELSEEARHAVFRAWLARAREKKTNFVEARQLLPLLDEEEVDVALELAEVDDPYIPAEFAGFVWKHAPERARARAIQALNSGHASSRGWTVTAPRAEHAFILQHLEDLDDCPSWVADWARNQAIMGSPVAEQFYRFERRLRGFPVK